MDQKAGLSVSLETQYVEWSILEKSLCRAADSLLVVLLSFILRGFGDSKTGEHSELILKSNGGNLRNGVPNTGTCGAVLFHFLNQLSVSFCCV